MGEAATVPVFAPDGSLGDIPAENLVAAVKAGYKPGVTMKSQDGSLGVIPADRVPDAAKGGLSIVPLKDQETQHPGFWHTLGSDLMSMLPDFKTNANSGPDMSGRVGAATKQTEADNKQQAADDAARKAAGYSDTYTALAPIAEGLGVNVKGMEESAKEGDRPGVWGHAAAVPTAMAATAGVAKGAGVVADVAEHPAFKSALAKVKQITPKQAAQVVGGTAGAVEGHGVLSAPGAYYGAKTAGSITEGVLGKERANAPIFGKKPTTAAAIERDATLDKTNIPEYAGEEKPGAPVERDATLDQRNIPEFAGDPPLIEMTDKLAGEIAKQRGATNFTAGDRLRAKSLLKDSLKSSTGDVVDAAIPPDKSYGPNLATKSRVEFYLQRGDIANAEKSLDAGAKQANPAWQPLDRQPVPSTTEIRERIQREAKLPKSGSAADAADDHALQQEMNWNLERHGWSAESEARREFIARNSTGMTKGELAKRYAAGSGKGASAAAPATPDDLTEELQKSLDAVRARSKAK